MTEAFKPTQVQLILAGEQLFAEHGIEGCSLHQIATRAGQANNTAVHYHFGSRESLVAAISTYRVQQLDRLRARHLRRLLRRPEKPRLRELLEVLLLVQLEIADERGRHPYAHFMVQYLLRYRPLGMPHASDRQGAGNRTLYRLIHMIEAELSWLPSHVVRQRLEFLHLSFLAMLARHDSARARRHEAVPLATAESARPEPSLAGKADEMIDMILVAIQVPSAG